MAPKTAASDNLFVPISIFAAPNFQRRIGGAFPAKYIQLHGPMLSL